MRAAPFSGGPYSIGHRLDIDPSHPGDLNPRPTVYEVDRPRAPERALKPIKRADSASNGALATVAKSGECRHTEALVFSSGTLKDGSANVLEAALARALDRATEAGQWDVVKTILAQVERPAVSEEGKRFATLDELKAATQAYAVAKLASTCAVVPGEATYGYDEQQELRARDIYMRLRAALRDGLEFARQHEGDMPSWQDRKLGRAGQALRRWGMIFSSTTAVVNFLALAPDEMGPAPHTRLKAFVHQWDAEMQLNDRVLALLALRDGWWPERMTKPVAETTVADVVDITRRAVKRVRKGK